MRRNKRIWETLASYNFQQQMCCSFVPSIDTLNERNVNNCLSTFTGAEVAVLCITKSGEVINYQAFTNSRGFYSVAETMPESDRWESCLARPISSFSKHCAIRGDKHSGVKFSYKLPSGQTHNVRPFLYKPTSAPVYCS